MNPLIASKVSIGIMYDVINQIRDLIFVVMKMQIRVTGSFFFVNLTVAKPLNVLRRRTHLSNGHTYQVDNPIGLDLELLKRALKEPPKTPLE